LKDASPIRFLEGRFSLDSPSDEETEAMTRRAFENFPFQDKKIVLPPKQHGCSCPLRALYTKEMKAFTFLARYDCIGKDLQKEKKRKKGKKRTTDLLICS